MSTPAYEGPLLEVRDLTVTYRSGKEHVYAARGVDFRLEAGETMGMAGESGSGKTTVALSLLRLLPAEADVTGQILFRGEDLMSASWGRMRAVRWAEASVVFQGAMSALNPVQTVGDQICEPIMLHEKVGEKEARARARALLDDVGVPSRRFASYPHEFSGGQRQRVMMAMALACRPDLVIADEPTTALDVIVQAQILALLNDLVRENGISLIMISHDLSVLAQTCDRLGVMYARGLPDPRRPELAPGAGRTGRRPARPARGDRRLPVRAPVPLGRGPLHQRGDPAGRRRRPAGGLRPGVGRPGGGGP